MRILLIFFLVNLAICSRGQSVQNKDNKYLTYEQNEIWLTTTKSLDNSGQWMAIKQRFFTKGTSNTSVDSIRYSPLLVINGVPFDAPSISTDEESEKILALLNEHSIEQIDLIDKFSEDWIFCNPFSGVIILKVDKKTEKKLNRLNLR